MAKESMEWLKPTSEVCGWKGSRGNGPHLPYIFCFSMVDFWNAHLGAWLRRAQPEVESIKNRPTTLLGVSILCLFRHKLWLRVQVLHKWVGIMMKDRHRPGAQHVISEPWLLPASQLPKSAPAKPTSSQKCSPNPYL